LLRTLFPVGGIACALLYLFVTLLS
jgi:hypothetical protein